MTETLGKYRVILLVGPPGSGKGTQGQALGQLPGWLFVSTGNLLRGLDSDEPGLDVKRYLQAGELVPAPTVVSIWLTHMKTQVAAGFDVERDMILLDGFPRNVEQARLLREHAHVEKLVHLACDDEEALVRRMLGRSGGRTDDADERVIRHRLSIYRQRTQPLLEWYPKEIQATVDGLRSPLQVLRQIVQVVPDPRP